MNTTAEDKNRIRRMSALSGRCPAFDRVLADYKRAYNWLQDAEYAMKYTKSRTVRVRPAPGDVVARHARALDAFSRAQAAACLLDELEPPRLAHPVHARALKLMNEPAPSSSGCLVPIITCLGYGLYQFIQL